VSVEKKKKKETALWTMAWDLQHWEVKKSKKETKEWPVK
jgi:hypothetical protein